jgi:hypothetical protein
VQQQFITADILNFIKLLKYFWEIHICMKRMNWLMEESVLGNAGEKISKLLIQPYKTFFMILS